MSYIELQCYPVNNRGGMLLRSTPLTVNRDHIVVIRNDGEGHCYLVTTTGVEYHMVDTYPEICQKLGIFIGKDEEEREHE